MRPRCELRGARKKLAYNLATPVSLWGLCVLGVLAEQLLKIKRQSPLGSHPVAHMGWLAPVAQPATMLTDRPAPPAQPTRQRRASGIRGASSVGPANAARWLSRRWIALAVPRTRHRLDRTSESPCCLWRSGSGQPSRLRFPWAKPQSSGYFEHRTVDAKCAGCDHAPRTSVHTETRLSKGVAASKKMTTVGPESLFPSFW